MRLRRSLRASRPSCRALRRTFLQHKRGQPPQASPLSCPRQYLFVLSTPVLGPLATSCQTCTMLIAVLAGNGRASNGAHTAEAAALLSEDATGDEDGGQQTMIRVIASQRDRLKERVNQLGDELSKVSQALWVL